MYGLLEYDVGAGSHPLDSGGGDEPPKIVSTRGLETYDAKAARNKRHVHACSEGWYK